MKIALDVMGGDHAPQNPMGGVKLALETLPRIEKILLVGVPEVIEREMAAQGIASPKLEIVPALQVVDMSDSGLDAVRKKKDSSISRAVDLVKDKKADAVVSAGHTGAAVTATFDAVQAHNAALNGGAGTLFLPMAFSAGSPSHPAYGAGHATVAGACVTVLKAWFDEDQTMADLFARAGRKEPAVPGEPLQILQPGFRRTGHDLEAFCEPMPYAGDDAALMTVGGELNKIASNVAMGRSMGGVHWRSDNTRSLRLGEDIAIEILRKRTLEYAERPVSFTFRSFDRQTVHITQGQVQRS